MAVYNEGKHVLTCNGIVLWDGVTKPEKQDDGSFKYSVKVAIPDMAPEKAELEQLATRTLNESDFKGVMPAGGNWPVLPIDMSKFSADAARLQGHISINAKSNYIPDVYDVNGNSLDAMAYGQMLYAGAIVQVLVGAYAFNNKSKGIAYSLEGIKIIDASAPKLSVGGGMSATEKASIMGGAPAQPTAQPQPSQPAAPIAGVQPSEAFLNVPGAAPTPAAPVAEAQYEVGGQVFAESALRANGWDDNALATQAKKIS